MMEAASTSETSVNFYQTGATTQKTAIFIIISNLEAVKPRQLFSSPP
jgi:hypothetical protein